MKTVLITGASRGIGLETTKIFLDNDFFVLGTSTSGKIPISHNNLKKIKLDLLSPDSINAAEDIFKTANSEDIESGKFWRSGEERDW